MRTQLFIGAAVAALVMPAAAYAQETSATIRGVVTNNGTPVASASVEITDTSSGAKSSTTTDSNGNFSATGLRAGGPYTIVVTSDARKQTITDIFTVVGSPYEVPVELASTSDVPGASSGDIVINASRIRGAGARPSGPTTVLTANDIAKVASVNRDIRDIERRDPFATLDLANSRAVSFAGVNPRFNRFSVDGVLVGDNFGLNPDASPTGRGPIPFDALGQVSVSIAPYDIRQGNFQGGAIDAILKSGTNEFHGTAFYSISTSDLQGKRIGSFTTTLPDYRSKTYGATISGPIIRDTLFFMISAERNVDPRPLAVTSISQIPGLNTTAGAAALSNIQSIASSKYGFTAGDLVSISPNKDEKIVGKIDWNIMKGQRLSLSYINAYDQSYQTNSTSTSTTSPAVGLASNYYQLSELLRAGIVQLNSDWSDSFSTEIRGLYKKYTRGQDPLNGAGFAQFSVCLDPNSTTTFSGVANTTNGTTCSVGAPRVVFGPDISRQANVFNTDTYAGSFLAKLKLGSHNLQMLAEYSQVSIFNLFLQNATGAYYFDSVADYQAGNANSLTYQNATTLNVNDAAASFKYSQFTYGIQDTWRVSDSLTLNYGFRYDLYGSHSLVPNNPNFVNRYGFTNTKTFKGLGQFQPRFNFEFKPFSTVSIRGGAGIFAGGTPDVYLSNSYSNTGFVTNQISINRNGAQTGPGGSFLPNGTFSGGASTTVGGAALNNVNGKTFDPAVGGFLSTNLGSLASAPTNAIDPSWDLPNVFKATLTGEWRPTFLGGGWTFGADFLYSHVRAAPQFTDIRSIRCGTLPDGRPRYVGFGATAACAGGDNTGNYDILLRSISLGRSFLGDVRFQKEFDFGLSFGGSFAVQDVLDASPATSSTATSNYSNGAFADPNFAAYGTSNDETKWRFTYNVGFDHAFFRDYKTRIQLFGETRAGRPYSFTMQDATGSNTTRGQVFGVLRTPNDRFLLYVPTGTSDAKVSYDTTATADSLNALINNSKLKNYRGSIAGRNIARSRAFTRIDLHLEQEIPTFVGNSRISLFADIENLPNLLNKNWGGLRQLGFPYVGASVTVQCLQTAVATGTAPTAAQLSTSAATPCTQYRYSAYRDVNEKAVSVSNSLYLIRVGARFTF